jgi:biotin synthase
LVTPNPGVSEDMQMLQTLGLKPMKRQAEKVMDQFENWKINA